jgi:hypothetical protein
MNTTQTARYKLDTNSFGNVSGIPVGWYKIGDGRTANKIRKSNPEIPVYEACVGFNRSGKRFSPILVRISHKDFEQEINEILNAKERKAEERQKKEAEAIKKALESRKKITEAVYSINKEAKRQRDIQARIASSIYDEGERYGDDLAHHQLHEAKERKQYLYRLKNTAIEKMVLDWGIAPIGYHEFTTGDCLDYYEIEGYGFHNGSCTSTVNLGSIEDEIEADRKRSIPPNKAIKIIQAWTTV